MTFEGFYISFILNQKVIGWGSNFKGYGRPEG
jgi:hypothetical protein